ncbi:MAG: DUF502 domain-containing protein [Planctomycetota bacterium]|nr:DUF502 domain-containing protein [Planctomycetota bacterium]
MPMDKNKPSRNFFLRGLVALLPAMLTTFAFVFIIQFTTRYVTGPINSAIYWTLERNAIGWTVLEALDVDPLREEFLAVYELTPELQSLQESAGLRSSAFQEALESSREAKTSVIYNLNQLAIDGAKLRVAVKKAIHPVVGLLVALLLLMVVGYLASGFLGRRVVAWFDRRLSQIPFIKWIYPYAKQFVEYFLSDSELEFDTVVAAPYPSPGVYCIAFVTSPGFRTLHDALGGKYVACFVPTSPMPMTGYTVFIEASRLIPLPISVDEALRTTISAGVLIPPNESVEELTQNLSAILGRPLDTKS